MDNRKHSNNDHSEVDSSKSANAIDSHALKFSEIPHTGWIILAMILYHYARKENTNG